MIWTLVSEENVSCCLGLRPLFGGFFCFGGLCRFGGDVPGLAAVDRLGTLVPVRLALGLDAHPDELTHKETHAINTHRSCVLITMHSIHEHAICFIA